MMGALDWAQDIFRQGDEEVEADARAAASHCHTGSNGLHGHCSVIRFVKQMYSVHTERNGRFSYTPGPV